MPTVGNAGNIGYDLDPIQDGEGATLCEVYVMSGELVGVWDGNVVRSGIRCHGAAPCEIT